MSTAEEALARCESLCGDPGAVRPEDVEWLIEAFDHPMKVVQRAAGTALVAIARAGTDVSRSLEDAMASDSSRRRWVAAWTAGQIPGVDARSIAPALFEALGVDDGDVRWAAARMLTGRAERDEVAKGLLALGASGNAAQRKMALYCLRDLGRRDAAAAVRYREGLRDDDAGVRLAAMSALARVGSVRADDARRIAALLDDPEGGVRRAAAATLGRGGVSDEVVRDALARAAQDDDPVLARIARGAIGRLR